jgi:peptidoglycan/xylan/chitin deacetylase (PgdA/CDA1 family)
LRLAFKITLGTVGGWIPQKLLIRASKQDLLFPYYHAVSDQPMPHVEKVYPVRSLKRFRKDLDFLLKYYEPMGLEDLKSVIRGEKRSKPGMFLSFDDGLSEIYHVVSPVLIAKGVPAAFFINTDFVDNRDLFYRYKSSLLLDRLETIKYSPAVTEVLQSRYHLASSKWRCVKEFLMELSFENRREFDDIASLVDLDFKTFLKIRKPYMSLDQVRELSERGFYIGAHSKDHPHFAEISPAKRLTQYRESMDYISKNLETGYRLFSFPFSDDGVPSEFFGEMNSSGGPVASFGTAGLKNDPVRNHFHRIQMEAGKVSAPRIIKGEYLYYLFKGPVGKNVLRRS